jgi:DNA-binding NtrC family response regulator
MELTHELQTMKLLLVDSDAILCRSVKSCLRHKVLSFDVAETGERALELLTHHVYDILLCDETLPGMNGVAFFKSLAKTHPNMLQKILIITYADLEVMHEAISVGITHFLQKPFNMETFMNSISMVISHRDVKPSSEIMVDGQRVIKHGNLILTLPH